MILKSLFRKNSLNLKFALSLFNHFLFRILICSDTNITAVREVFRLNDQPAAMSTQVIDTSYLHFKVEWKSALL